MNVDPGLVPLAFIVAAVLALATVPLAAAVFLAAALLLFLNPAPLPADFLASYSLALRLNSPALISIPLFALAGELAVASGITRRLLNVADIIAGRGKRAVGARVILGCTLFASVSGAGPDAVAAEGKRIIPEMLKAGYRPGVAAGALAAAAGLSIIIPASIPLTVYAATIGLRTNIVFTASFVPGLLVAAALFLVMQAISILRPAPPGSPRPASIKRKIGTLRNAAWSLLMPALLLSSLFTGFLTAPEAAAFGSAYALAVGALVHRSLTPKAAWDASARAARTAAAVLLVVGVGGLFAALMETAGFTQRLADAAFAAAGGATGAILLMNLVLLAAGCVMDTPAIISLVIPLLLPLAEKCGLSPPHFGVMAVVNLAIGLITPPMASNLATAAGEAGTSMRKAAIGGLPFLAAMIACLLLTSFLPELSLWLPRVFGWPTQG